MLGLPAAAQAATVTNNADSGPGSLRAAIANSASGETIDFAQNLNGSTISLTSALVVQHALTISGPGADSLTINGSGRDRVFDIEPNTPTDDVTISGLTITGGAANVASRGGGGILSTAALLTLNGVSVINNQATISNGGGSAGGGGIYVGGEAVRVTNSMIAGNQASISGATSGSNGGGGLYDSGGGAITLTGSSVAGNTVRQTATVQSGSDGGGGIFSNGGPLTITNTSVDHNTDNVDSSTGGSDGGGGIHDSGGDMTLNGATVNENTFTVGGGTGGGIDGGGGILTEGGALSVSSSSIDGNTLRVTDNTTSGDDGGGGVLSQGGAITVTGSSISANGGSVTTASGGSTGDGGGGVLDEGANTKYLNSTIAENSLTVNGGGPQDGGGAILADSGGTATDVTIAGNAINRPGAAILNRRGTFRFRNTIIAGNGANCTGTGTFASDGFNEDSGNTCGLGAAGDLTNSNPLLGPLQNNGGPTPTRALQTPSPGVDAGSCTDAAGNAITTDQRGVARPQPAGGKCDIGAYELVPPPPVAQTAAPSSKSSTSATFTGTVIPQNLPTTYFFQYGLDPNLRPPGSSTALYDQSTPPQSLPAGSSPITVFAKVFGLVPNARYHVRLVAINGSGTAFGPDVTFATSQDAPPRPPVLGRNENVKPISGHVFELVRGRLVPLTEATKLRSGAVLDARLGSVELTAATVKPHKRETGVFGGAVFSVTQNRKGLTTLALVEGAFKGAPSYASCGAHRSSDAHATRLSSRVLQTLRSRASGHFRTRGRFAAGTVRGTRWTTADRCDGTLIAVQQHSVLVTDFVKHVTVLVKAGHRYLAHRRK